MKDKVSQMSNFKILEICRNFFVQINHVMSLLNLKPDEDEFKKKVIYTIYCQKNKNFLLVIVFRTLNIFVVADS